MSDLEDDALRMEHAVLTVLLDGRYAKAWPMLQDLMNYPVVTTGFITAPRGVGTMVAMILVGRLIGMPSTKLARSMP